MRRSLAVLLALALTVAACSGDDDDDDDAASVTSTSRRSTTSTTEATTESSTVAPSTTVPGCDPGAAPTAALTGGGEAYGQLTAVTVDIGDCTDIVTFGFSTPVPGYSVEYQPGPFVSDGSGKPVTVTGAAFIVVRLEPAYSFVFEKNVETYTGPREIVASGQEYVQEIANTGDFEAVMTWVIGLSEAAAVAVSDSGTNLVLTIGSPG